AIKLCTQSFQSGFAILPVNAPYTYQSDVMKDLEAITGAKYYDVEQSRLEDISFEDVGQVVKLLARRWDAIVAGPEDMKRSIAIADRVNTLQQRLEGSLSDFDRKLIETRIAQFRG